MTKNNHKDNIDKYNLNPNLCKFWNSKILVKYENNITNIKRKKFCNSSCSAKYNNSIRKINIKKCIYCEKELKKGIKYCSNKCKVEYEYIDYINKWKNGEFKDCQKSNWNKISRHIRKYLFQKYKNKCSLCGWSKINPYSNTIPLEIEHIDGDAKNNEEENLTLLCPNCHSLTCTYRGLNKGKGTRNITWIPK